MSIKIEGDGNKENVFSDSDSGMPLWNGTPFGLLPPNLSKCQTVCLSGPDNLSRNPFIVPEDGWIIGISGNSGGSCTIDGISGGPILKAIYFLDNENNSSIDLFSLGTPYPVKKGQAISTKDYSIIYISFAPCMSI